MIRDFPPLLKAHLEQDVTTVCRLAKFILSDGRMIGLTSLDIDVLYGGLNYMAVDGFEMKNIQYTAGETVDNTELRCLLSDDLARITKEMLEAGDLDGARYELYLVNWKDLGMGAASVGAGDVGKIDVSEWGAATIELLDYSIRFNNQLADPWCIRCRAVFGSPAESLRGCGVDASTMWRTGTATNVWSQEPRVLFYAASLSMLGLEIPARVQFTSGRNASTTRMYQVEAINPTLRGIRLFEELPYPVAIGDNFRIRNDCDKTLDKCKSYGNVVNYKGEPFIPLADGVQILTPYTGV